MSVMMYLARDFSWSMVLLQTSAPMIHCLHPMCLQLICNTMGKAVLEEHMFKKGQAVSFSKLREIGLQKKEVLKVKLNSFLFIQVDAFIRK